MDQLGNKADLTPSPKRSSSNWGCLTGETNDVVSSYGFALTEQASVIRLIPRRSHCSPIDGKLVSAIPRDGSERGEAALIRAICGKGTM